MHYIRNVAEICDLSEITSSSSGMSETKVEPRHPDTQWPNPTHCSRAHVLNEIFLSSFLSSFLFSFFSLGTVR